MLYYIYIYIYIYIAWNMGTLNSTFDLLYGVTL